MRSIRSFTSRVQVDALRGLNAINGFGPQRIKMLMDHFEDPCRIFAASPQELSIVPGLPAPLIANLKTFNLEEFLIKDDALIKEHGVRVITLYDKEYPDSLKEIFDPPLVLYIKGCLPSAADTNVAVIGARQASLYGLNIAERFAMTLGEMGVVVVSGLARGIDGAAHRGALKSGARTVAVLGCGLDIVYPRQNARLYRKIPQQGAIISEFPMGTLPLPGHFPRRNRIVSGLSQGVVVVEARVKSGALITARVALDQGREVFAVPGPIDHVLSEGPHHLIRQGAKLTLSVQDVLDELLVQAQWQGGSSKAGGSKKPDEGLSKEEKCLTSLVREQPLSLEQLSVRTGRSSTSLITSLFVLCLKGVLEEGPGKIFRVRGV